MSSNASRGVAYEPYALSKYAGANPKRVVFGGKGGIPDVLLALASGKDVSPETTKKLKREYAVSVNNAVSNGETPKGLSEHFGMDGVSVDSKAWSMHKEDLLSSMNVIECKVGLTDCHVLGPTIARQFINLAVYGPEKLPRLTLLSPHKPTPAVFDTFAPLSGAFRHELIPEPPLSSSAARADGIGVVGGGKTSVDIADGEIDVFQWQKTIARRTLREWKKGTHICVANVVMGLGKTVAGWAALQRADKWPLRIFCAHTTIVADQAREEAVKLGIGALDLTYLCKTKEGVDSAVRGTEYTSDSSMDDEHVAEECEPTADECARIISKLTDLSRRACADKPIYTVLCHTTLRALAVHGLGRLGCGLALVIDESHKLKNCKAIYEAILSPINNTHALLMTATPPKTWDVGQLGETTARELAKAPVVMRLGLDHGIAAKRLVPTHVEVVVGADAESWEVCDASEASVHSKAQATAAWIVSNNFATASVYTSRTDDADAFASALGPAIEAITGNKAWCASVHSKKKTSDNDAALEHLKTNTFASDGVMHKVVVSVGQLKEGFNMPSLTAVVLLEPPGDAASALQMAGRAMRAFPGKTIARMLVFGEDSAAASVGRMLHAYDREFKAITVGCVASTYEEQIKSAVEGPTRTALEAKARAFERKTRERLENLALAACDNRTLRTAQTIAFVKQFAAKKPIQGDGQKLEYFIDKVKCRINAAMWLAGVRGDWHRSEGSYLLSESNKAALVEGLQWFDLPEDNSEKARFSHTQRVHQVHEFINAHKRLPNRASSDALEKAIGAWLDKLTLKGSLCSEKRVRKEAGDAAVDALLLSVAATPSAKQAADHINALKNVEGLAHACLSFRECKGRNPWPAAYEKPHGYFLDSVRSGQLGPDVQEEALSIVHRVLADPLDAAALAHLEASLSMGVSKHDDYKRKKRERDAAKRNAKKRKLEDTCMDEDP